MGGWKSIGEVGRPAGTGFAGPVGLDKEPVLYSEYNAKAWNDFM